jgi:nucleotide-binding universal stress UspA family protein
MVALKTVLCPVDFSPATPRQVDVAAELSRAFGARLVVHHNLQSFGMGASVGWMWHADHGNPQAAAEARLRECLSRVPEGVFVEPVITEGPNSRAVMTVAEAADADLVLLTAHETMSEEHASITERMIEHGERAVLVLHEPSREPRVPHFASRSSEPQVVLVPTDLTPEARSAVEVGIDLARRLPIELHLLHVLPKSRTRDEEADEKVRSRLHALVYEDLGPRVHVHVEHGDPAETIARVAGQVSAACIVMGGRTRHALRRLFGRDTSREVLHQARCPVWYVPPGRES